MKLKKRIAALLMAGAIACSAFPVNVLAEENSNQNMSGLCGHHTKHDASCGYTEGSEGTPCTHEHNEDCYTLVTECVHEHTGDCCPLESVSNNTATPSDTEALEPADCQHQCSEESGCITKELNCKHTHDAGCGYTEGTKGSPCGFVCEICGSTEQPADPTEQPAEPTEQPAEPTAQKLVSEWTWKLPVATEDTADDKNPNKTSGNLPFYQNDRWELTLPVTSADRPMSKEQVIELLPKEIILTWEKPEEKPEPNPEAVESEPTGADAAQLSLLEDQKITPLADEGEEDTTTPPAGDEEDTTTSPAEAWQSEPNPAVAALTWEIADYPAEGAYSGEFIATATLPAEYLLKEGVAPLQLFLSFRAGVDLTVLKNHELNSMISPAGTKINLFDYWLSDSAEDRLNPDHQPLKPDGTENHDEDLKEDVERKSKGINKDHVLKFISWGGDW